ncbi:MAG: hypothetical protein OEY32_15270, partial [Candidatus Krumholzibacteria bacterium]|nr:hypothetical protein [Candidatus Krumholzibacteria bacterium]
RMERCLVARNENENNIGVLPEGAVRASNLLAVNCIFYDNIVVSFAPESPIGTAITASNGSIVDCIIIGGPCIEQCGTVVYSPTPENLMIECSNIWSAFQDA